MLTVTVSVAFRNGSIIEKHFFGIFGGVCGEDERGCGCRWEWGTKVIFGNLFVEKIFFNFVKACVICFDLRSYWTSVKTVEITHCTDVIMITMASQITSLTVIYSTVYSDADQRKHQSSASLTFVWGINRDRWIPRTKGQLRGKCFHLMTSSWE